MNWTTRDAVAHELYDLAADPAENVNVAARRDLVGVVADLEARRLACRASGDTVGPGREPVGVGRRARGDLKMTAAEFRVLALALPMTSEGAHMGHPDFRVGGKIFASLGPAEAWGMVKLSPTRQAAVVREAPEAFEPSSGAWGRQGATQVHLAAARKRLVRRALADAWLRVAPKTLVDEYGDVPS